MNTIHNVMLEELVKNLNWQKCEIENCSSGAIFKKQKGEFDHVVLGRCSGSCMVKFPV